MNINVELRLAVDTGEVSIGYRSTYKTIASNKAKLVIVPKKGNNNIIDDIKHLCKVSNIKLIEFDGNAIDLGNICGKPYSINAIAIIDQGNAHILGD